MAYAGTQLLVEPARGPAEIQATLDRMGQELHELRRHEAFLKAGFEHLEEQLLRAAEMQRHLLPDPLPASGGLRIHTLYQPADHVSGDMYDIVRVDESQLAFSLADATGHGLPAALLTILVQRAFRPQETTGSHARTLPPSEVLSRLNRELLETNLPHGQFIAGLQAVYDERTGWLTWARAGLPYPILIRGGRPRQLRTRGTILGVLESIVLEPARIHLMPGDTVLLHTDGLNDLLEQEEEDGPITSLTESAWYRGLGQTSLADHLTRLEQLGKRASANRRELDDLTIVALQLEE